MATIKVKFKPTSSPTLEGSLIINILHAGKIAKVPTDYRLFPDEWNERRGEVRLSSCGARNERLRELRHELRRDISRLRRITRRLEETEECFTAAEVAERFRNFKRNGSLFRYMEKIISELKQTDRLRTAETYRSALRSFSKFRKGKDIMLDALNAETMTAFQHYLSRRGLVPNTISFYNRILRAVYNRAVDEELIDDLRPFRRVYTGVDKTRKRALPFSIVKTIRRLDLRHAPHLDFARDAFILSFMLRGMSFVDMAFLPVDALKNGILTYRRRKTGRQLMIAWTPDMQQILDKYSPADSCYLFPYIRSTSGNPHAAYRNAGYNINRQLKIIGRMVGLTIPLTLYVARHSWATAARTMGVPLSVISEGMGHDSESTTQIYLSSLDTTTVDRANALILSSL